MQWVCEVCGFVHDEDELPIACPLCGAPQSKFKEYTDEESEVSTDEESEENTKDALSERDEDFEKDLYGDLEE